MQHPEVIAADLTPWGMYLSADLVVKIVMIVLAVASIATWTVLVAKSWELSRAARQLRQARAFLLDTPSLPVAQAPVGAGVTRELVEAAQGELTLSHDVTEREGIKERVASRLERIELAHAREQRSGVGVLASIGAVGPFVGLFGTVWGIMNSFVGIAGANTTNLAVVAPGIAEALLATALGLVAAIPAVLVHNHITRTLAGVRLLVGDVSAAVQQLVSRDLDRRTVRPSVTPLRMAH
ncbi:MAG: Biopolymer transport protein ExbB [Luteibacter sp.]|uniref:tonB-system energizer ExbB n=1 Tax=Luteibacter sp. TaxID=1886636 RepID=UPI0013816F66|nr:tonB-system energizer ExbB [Luteibacter sp.]KAF1008263.1 MAG: Biopolymer transport protein ExbB [Luteibacter sp.]